MILKERYLKSKVLMPLTIVGISTLVVSFQNCSKATGSSSSSSMSSKGIVSYNVDGTTGTIDGAYEWLK